MKWIIFVIVLEGLNTTILFNFCQNVLINVLKSSENELFYNFLHFSLFKIAVFALIPPVPEYPPISPFDFITLWQGMTGAKGFFARAVPTARYALARAIWRAIHL